ncbi:hypothetical protein FE810_00015 [Thalassotalea litorea]|uniref:Uncharacterized protein n=1 Tax=Thalassotalea litorea TaxID=2020715 RepID=A0A5R9J1E4_9GAMM|nr:hypothetical protein [Thalassotalea litorea]TLU68038.1 hypothetical protein FE810_00015 [Thalassotalea litorea]
MAGVRSSLILAKRNPPLNTALGIQNMTMRFLTFLLMFFSTQVFACFAPIQGEEYDALVVITKIGKNRYSYEFPLEVHGYKNDGTVILALSQEERGSIMADSPHMEIFPKEVSGKMKGEFTIPENETNAFLIVSWPPEEDCCLCSFLAYSKLVNRE